MAEGIFGTDVEGRCTFANEAAQKMLGHAPDEIIGHAIHDLFHHSNADGSPHLREDCPIYFAYTQGITSFRRDEVFWRKDGSFFDVSYTSVPQRKGEAIMKEQLRRRATDRTSVYEIALSRPDGSKLLCLFRATPFTPKMA